MAKANTPVQALKNQAERLATYLGSMGRSITRTQALEAMSRAVHGKPWNTVRTMVGTERDPRIAGRLDGETGRPLVLSDSSPALTTDELRRITNDSQYYLDVVVPVSIWDISEYDLEWLNDFVSESITGSEAGLTDIRFERYMPERADELAKDPALVFIRVTGNWEPEEEYLDENVDTSTTP